MPTHPYVHLRADLLEFQHHLEQRSDWKPVSAPDHVEAMVLDTSDLAYPIVRCRVKLGCSAEVLNQFLVADVTQTLKQWSRDIDTCEEVEHLSEDERILLVRTRGPVAIIAAREDLFYQCTFKDTSANYYELSRYVERPEPPVAKGSVRSQMYFASKRMAPAESGCLYDVMWQYDPAGWMSHILPQSIVIKSIHDHLKDECLRLLKKYPLG